MQGREKTERWTQFESSAQDASDSDQEGSEQEGSEFVSLEELGSLYAKALHGEQSPSEASRSQPATQPSNFDFHGSITIQGETDGVPVSIGSIIEALLFVGTRDGQSVSLEQLSAAIKEFSQEEILHGIEVLDADLESQNSSVRVSKHADGFRLSLTPELEARIEELKWGSPKQAVLSQAAVDCLSLVAYQPGVQREDLESQLGQTVGATISLLQRRGLIAFEGGGYHTTDRFLEIAGIDTLEDLPKADDL
jgi:segregation and condensation protein B